MDFHRKSQPAEKHPMKTTTLRLLSLLTLTLGSLHAAADPRLAALRTADDARVAAIFAADRARLTAAYSDDLHYAHSTGVVDGKAAYTDANVSGRTNYILFDYQKRNFTFPSPGIA